MRGAAALAVAALAAGAAPAAGGPAKDFDIPGGDAAEAFREFARQSGSEIMFLSGSLGGVVTAAVKGSLPARVALDRMVAGTDLVVTRDEQSGAFTLTRREPPDRIVRLPPYLVTATASPLRWKYAAVPGFEILSCARGVESEEFVREIYRQQAWLDEIVPPGLQARGAVPTSLILFDDGIREAISANLASIAGESTRRLRQRFEATGVRIPPAVSSLLPQVKLWDEDSTGVDIVLGYRPSGGLGTLGFQPDYVFFLLARQVPPLPSWFTEGVLGLYQTRVSGGRMGTEGGPAPMGIDARGGMGGAFESRRAPPTRQRFSPAVWISPDVNSAVREDFQDPGSLLPLGSLLAGEPPPPGTQEEKRKWLTKLGAGAPPAGEAALDLSPAQVGLVLARGADPASPWRRDVWRSQALLLVRWALDDDTFDRRRSLWRFVARSRVEQPTEAMFRECFGMGFAEAGRQLGAYVTRAVKRPLNLVPQRALEIPFVEMRDSTEEEEARILGDWERKEYEFVKASHPEFAGAYARQAEGTFMQAYRDGVHAPGFLAALGIFECTVADDARARGFLEEAVSGTVLRPRAYVELARIRLQEALSRPGGPGGTLDRRQVASVMAVLREGRTQSPPQFGTYAQAAEALEHAGAAPSREDLLLLDEGCRLFPNDPRLRLAEARLRIRMKK
jgi:hypothetical protein